MSGGLLSWGFGPGDIVQGNWYRGYARGISSGGFCPSFLVRGQSSGGFGPVGKGHVSQHIGSDPSHPPSPLVEYRH